MRPRSPSGCGLPTRPGAVGGPVLPLSAPQASRSVWRCYCKWSSKEQWTWAQRGGALSLSCSASWCRRQGRRRWSPWKAPVSYTHLTLPTICSV
eukprot:7823351-Alexandrium_andersonii.AAC.1